MGVQKPRNGKEGLGYVAKKKNNNKKKGNSPQAKKDNTVGGNATKGKSTSNDLQESLILTISYIVIITVMSMQNMLVLLMVIWITLFGSLRPLLLTKEDPLKDGYLIRLQRIYNF